MRTFSFRFLLTNALIVLSALPLAATQNATKQQAMQCTAISRNQLSAITNTEAGTSLANVEAYLGKTACKNSDFLKYRPIWNEPDFLLVLWIAQQSGQPVLAGWSIEIVRD